MHESTLNQHAEQAVGATNFRIFTSFRLDVPNDPGEAKGTPCDLDQLFPFPLHQERLLRAARAFGWSSVADRLSGPLGFQRLADAVGSELSRNVASVPLATAFKVRLTVSRDAVIGVECSQLANGISNQGDRSMYLPKELVEGPTVSGICKVVLDTEPIHPSLFTTHKTTVRTAYENARERANISKVTADHAEVLLVNPNGEIMEASTSTPYFYRTGRWVTPPLSSGGNAGVSRRIALETRLCVEEVVRVDSLRDKETVWISNGVRGFIMGSLRIHK